MKVSQAVNCYFDYHKVNSKKNTIRNYEFVLSRFYQNFGERDLESITTEEILSFLTQITQGTKQTTKRSRYTLLTAFFNFVKNSIGERLQNPCDSTTCQSFDNSTVFGKGKRLGGNEVD